MNSVSTKTWAPCNYSQVETFASPKYMRAPFSPAVPVASLLTAAMLFLFFLFNLKLTRTGEVV